MEEGRQGGGRKKREGKRRIESGRHIEYYCLSGHVAHTHTHSHLSTNRFAKPKSVILM